MVLGNESKTLGMLNKFSNTESYAESRNFISLKILIQEHTGSLLSSGVTAVRLGDRMNRQCQAAEVGVGEQLTAQAGHLHGSREGGRFCYPTLQSE